MRGFPRHINTKQDFENLLSMSGYKGQAMTELTRLSDMKDSKITKATTQIDPSNPESEGNTIEIDNPQPEWQRRGFKSKTELNNMLLTAEASGK